MEAYPFPQNGIRPFRKAGCNVRASVDNARYIDSLRGHLDSGGAVSVHRKRYCNAANVAHRRRLCYKDTERSVTG